MIQLQLVPSPPAAVQVYLEHLADPGCPASVAGPEIHGTPRWCWAVQSGAWGWADTHTEAWAAAGRARKDVTP